MIIVSCSTCLHLKDGSCRINQMPGYGTFTAGTCLFGPKKFWDSLYEKKHERLSYTYWTAKNWEDMEFISEREFKI